MGRLVMGVVNVTPDSFSDGGRFVQPEIAIAHARALIGEGADIVDVGGESTRPGAEPVDEATELARVLPVVEAVAGEIRVSIDTTKAAVAEAAIDAGATMVNDVSASLAAVAAAHGVAWVAMHRQGTPATMQQRSIYTDVVAEVRAYLVGRAAAGRAAGVTEVWIDPGIGFAKTTDHNLALLAHLDELVATGLPVVVGTSRKSMLGDLLGRSDARGGHPDFAHPADRIDAVGPDDRLEGSLATATWAMAQGAAMIRVHDVRAALHAASVVAA